MTVTAFSDLPLAPRDAEWDSTAADQRVREFTQSTEAPGEGYAQAFLWFDGREPELFGSYKFPFADVVDGELKAVPAGLFAAVQRLDQANLSETDKDDIRGTVGQYYAKMREVFQDEDIIPPWERANQAAAVSSSGIVVNPPASWFDHPGEIPTDKRMTIQADGRVYGYVALWDSCHVGLEGCVKPPKGSPTNYEYAHIGETLTAEGGLVKTAVIAGAAPHVSERTPAHEVPDLYANTGRQYMRVRYGEDDQGLWFAGALFPDVSAEEIVTIRASAVSGDWRWHTQWRHGPSGYDFSGSILVNVPGYRMATAGDPTLGPGRAEHIAASAAAKGFEGIIGLDDYYRVITAASGDDTVSETCSCKNEPVTADAAEETLELSDAQIDAIAKRVVALTAAAGDDAGEGEDVKAEAHDGEGGGGGDVGMKLDAVLEGLGRLENILLEQQASALAEEILI